VRDVTALEDRARRAADAAILARLPARLREEGRIVEVHNKCDLVAGRALGPSTTHALAGTEPIALSARTGAGLDALRRRLLDLAGWQADAEGVFIARTRHVEALKRTRRHVDSAVALATQGDAALELLAEELRLAHDALGEITGAFTPDDLLGVIFSRFCIGK
jgi:tRNA modification GTPase